MIRTKSDLKSTPFPATITGVSASYSTSKKIALEIDTFPPDSSFIGHLYGLIVRVDTMASSPTKVFYKICSDADGDEIIIPNTSGDIDTGITTNTKGAVAYRIDFTLKVSNSRTVYIFFKTDTGTLNVYDGN